MQRPALSILLTACAACGGAGTDSPTAVRMRGECMGTTWSAVVTLQSGEAYGDVVQLIQDELDAVDRALSTWKDDSDLSRLNRSPAGEAVEVEPVTLDVLRLSGDIVETTGGAFDPTVGPLVQLWGFGAYDETEETPSAEAIDAAHARVDWPAVEVGDGWVRRSRDDVEVDASAIAKGHAVDLAAARLVESGHDEFLLEVGGELLVRGNNPDGVPWRVGVDDPLPPEGTDPVSPMGLAPRPPIARLGLTGGAVATSGDYRNVRRVGGRLVCHAIDPRSGEPIDHDLASATVVAPTCAAADALATATLVLGPVDGLALLERIEGVEGYLLVRTGDPASPLEARLTAGITDVLLDGPGSPGAAPPLGR